MESLKCFQDNVFKINKYDFETHALDLFRLQARDNTIYKTYLEHLGTEAEKITSLHEIPFLPIEFFRSNEIKTGSWSPDTIFESSSTTGSLPSKHAIWDLSLYKRHSARIFEQSFGSPADYIILALLPSYLERQHSSLVSMVDHLIKRSENSQSGFYIHNTEELINLIGSIDKSQKIVLFGVTFALLGLAEKYSMDFSNVTVIETGGMKGSRKEITREELYEVLCESFSLNTIYSEYGMTELLSQAYGKNGKFQTSDFMKIFIREINDPFNYLPNGRTGGINIIDMANIYSCAFIETQDIGRMNDDGSFEVLGRIDNSELRGCNLMLAG